MIVKCEKRKVYSRVFCVSLFSHFTPFFCFSQHFVPVLAFVWKVEGFRGLFFCGINKTRNLHEIRKVYSECFVFCGVLRKHSQNAKYEKCISGLKLAIHLLFLVFWHVRALFREIANQSLYTSHNITDFVYLWFREKLDEKLAVSSSLTFRENTDRLVRTATREMRKMIGETVYKVHLYFSFLSFCQHFFTFSSIWR